MQEVPTGAIAAAPPRPDLFRTGNAQRPSALRTSINNPGNHDVFVDDSGDVEPTAGGLSVVKNEWDLTTKGHVWRLPGNLRLPDGLQVVNDPPPPGHYLIRPAFKMSITDYQNAIDQLTWVNTGRKRK